MLSKLFLLAAIAAPALGFHVAPPMGSVARRTTSPLRMQVAPEARETEAASFSRRSFFRSAGAGALTVGALGLEVPQSAFAEPLPTVNQPAPDFSLPSNRGKSIGLKDLKGKWAVLYFYPGDFTSGCTIEAQNFEKNAEKIRGLGAEIVGVSVDSAEKHLDFAKQYGLSFALLSDKDGLVSKQYGTALSIPFMGTFSNRQTYLIDPEGKLRWVFTDVQSRLAKHAEEVVAKLKDLQA